MSGEITVELIGLDSTVARINGIPQKAKTRLRQVLSELGIEFVLYVRSTKLSGDPLKVKTGNLRNSIYSEVKESGDTIEVEAGSRGVPYAAYHEYGFHGTEHVRAYQRRVTQVFGRSVDTVANVRAHDRHVNYSGRPYLRASADEFRPIILSRLDTVKRDLGFT